MSEPKIKPARPTGKKGCAAKSKLSGGNLCGAPAVAGTDLCTSHSGISRLKHKARGAVVVEVLNWGLGDTTVDPGEVLLRLVTQSAARAEKYAAVVEQLVADNDGSLPKALTADSYTVSDTGMPVKTGEYVRAMARLEAEERDRCAGMATKAIAAGLAERQVRLAEKQGALIAQAIKAILDDLNLTPEQQALVGEVVPRHLRSVS